jgi:RHS repeat-associated protein
MRRRWLGGGMLAMAACVAGIGIWLGQSASAAGTCSIYWTGRASSNWSATANWSSSDGGQSAGRLPGRSDYVCMSSAPSRATVSLSGGAVVDGISWPKTASVTPVLQLSGSLTVGTTEAAFASTLTDLQMTGTLSTTTSIVVSSLSLEPGGTLGGAGTVTVPSGGSLSISGGTLASGMHLTNQGAATVAQGASLTLTEASTFENAASLGLGDSSAMEVNSSGRVVNDISGTLTYAGSAASSTASVDVPFDNYGAVSVTQGTLDLDGGSSAFSAGDTGSYSATGGGVVEFGGGTRKLTNQVSFPGSGQIAVAGQLDLAQGTGLTIANLLLDNGTLAGRGTLTIPAGGNADLAGGSFQGGLHLINKGNIDVAAIATLNFLEASELQNDGTLRTADDAQIGDLCCSNDADGFLVNNAGASFSYEGSATSSTSTVNVPFDNYGAVNVTRGTLNIDSSSSSESNGDTGSYTTAAAGGLTFSGATRTLAASATFQGAGQVTVSGQLGLDAGTTLSLSNLLLSDGTLSGHGSIVVPSGGSATLANGTLAGGFRLLNRGTTTVATGSSIDFADASVLENAGTLALSDGDQVGVPCCSNDADGTLLNDSGATVGYTGSASNSTTAASVSFDNFGTVTVGRGTLELDGGSSSASAGDSGVYDVSASAFLSFSGTRLFKASVSFPGAGEVDAYGDLDFLGNTTLPSLGWQGATIEVNPGSVLTATISGTPSGTLQLDGDRPGHFGSFAATGPLNVGSLYLNLSNETFAPPCGETIPLAKGSSLSGEFTYVNDNLLPAGGSLQTSYTSTAAKTLVHCPPPPTPAQQTYGTGRIFDAANPSGYYAEPVNTATGAYSNEQTDAELHSLGVPFTFTRYYTSTNTASGSLGPGWSDSLSASLTPEGGTVFLTSENGQQVTYTEQPDGSYLGAPGVYSHLEKTSTGWTLTRRDRSKLKFDSTGKLLSITDGNGMGLTLTYNSTEQLESVKDSAGHTVTFTYNEGLLTSISLPLSRTIHYAYTAGRLTSVTDTAGDVTSYAYTSSGLLTSIKDANGHTVVQNTYNESGQVVTQVNALGQKSTFAYNSGETIFTDALGHKWTDRYSGNVLVSRTDPLGHTTSYVYDSNLDLSAITDPNGYTTLMDYDGSGNLLDRTSPAPFDYEERWTYNALDEPLTYTDRRGLTTSYAYDSRGNLLKVTAPDGTSANNTYSASTGALLSSTTASGHTTNYAYDSSGDLIKVTSPLGEITTYGYDAAGRRTSEVSPRGNAGGATPSQFTTTYAYDADDRLVSVTNPLGGETTITYDKVGNKLSVKNPDAHTTSYAYDAANHLTKITAPDATTTTSTYDAVGDLTGRTDANGNTTTYTYDAAHRLISVKTPLGHTTTYSYEGDGNLAKTVDAVGATTTYTYDALDRLTSRAYSDGTPTVKYSYDADSNRTAMTDGTGTTSYTYNNRNLLTKKTHGSSSFAYTYTADGLVSTRTYPDGHAVSNTYDADDRLAKVASGGETTTYAYDPDGDLTSTTLPSGTGVVESRTYDDADRLAGVAATHGATTLDSYTITRDAAGNPTALSTPGGPVTYAYDSRERLTEACYGASCATNNETFTYDGVGNRLTSTTGGVATTNTYNADDEVTKSVTGATTVTPTYDADGRMTAFGSVTYSWNAANQMTAVGGPHAATYSYDGDGNRVAVKVGSATTTQTWDTNNPLPQLATTQGAAGTQNYLWGAGSLGFTTSAGSFYQLHDEQGSTVGVISANGTLQSTASYDPFGVTIATTKPVSTAPTSQIGWQAHLVEPNGQYDLRARQYEPSTGQFLSRDPASVEPEAPAVSSYLYANDMPTVGTDPSGECALDIFGNHCSGTGKVVLTALDVTAAAVGGACAVVSLGSAVPCDAAAAWGVVSATNEVYTLATSGDDSNSNYNSYNYSYSYNSYGGDNTYYGGYPSGSGRGPSK